MEAVAPTPATVLIRGESGVGKSWLAHVIHASSPRAAGPFVRVNCAALPAELLESELLGHERGAFTGAWRRKPGRLELADGGTICLDEIGEMPLGLQAKLLHLVEDLCFSRLGGRELIRVDARIIATTNRNLEAAVRHGEFREDLYYRLNVVEIRIPPLRVQREAIPKLAAFFLGRCGEEYGRTPALSLEALELFRRYPWPGNIRELENIVRRLVVLGSPLTILAEMRRRVDGGAEVASGSPGTAEVSGRPPDGGATGARDLRAVARRAAREAERVVLLEVLKEAHWNRSEAARVLGVSYKTVLRKLVECGITPPPEGQDRGRAG